MKTPKATARRTLALGLFCLLIFVLGATTSRNDYMTFVQSVYSGLSRAALQTINAPQKYGAVAARRESIMHQIGTGGPTGQHATNAIQLLRAQSKYLDNVQPKSVDVELAVDTTEAYLRVRNSPAITPADRSFAQSLILRLENLAPPRPLEYGAMNRAMYDATQRRLIMLLFPNAPPSSVPSDNDACANNRACYTQRVWNDWAATSDNYENSIHYNAVWWAALMDWIRADNEFKVRDERSVLGEPGVKALVYRYLAQASPLGIMPEYGDANGLNEDPGLWIRLMEDWATAYHDGQFKWVAHRMFEWTAPQKPQMDKWGNITQSMMDNLMAAYVESDNSIPERVPALGSMITYRHAMDFNPTSQSYPLLKPQTIPDKLILRSGWNPNDFYALIDLAPYMGHGHEDAGAVDLMTSNGSVLLADTPYLVRDHRFHNAFILDADGFTFPNKQYSNSDKYLTAVVSKESIKVPRFANGTLGSYAQTVITPYVGQPATLIRRFLLVKNQFLWVIDDLKATERLQATVGPAWQTVAKDSKSGANWVNTRMSTIPVADIWNLKYLMQWSNKPWDLLVVFPKSGEGTIKIDDVSRDTTHQIVKQDVQNTANYRVWNQKHVALQPNEDTHFSSVLVPHAPGQDTSDLAGRFQILQDSANQSALRFQDSNGETWYAGINDSASPVQVGPLKTDAQAFIVQMRGNVIEQSWHEGGTYVHISQ